MSEYIQIDILYAEDNPADAELTLYTLKTRNIANTIVWVRDGVEALDFLKRRGRYANRVGGAPKLVLLDLKMPKLDGVDVLRAMKADESTRGVPVVILTSSHEEADLVKSYKLGVNSYVVKPVDFDRFAEVVTEVGLYWMVCNKTPEV
jgi:two-component system response regulator